MPENGVLLNKGWKFHTGDNPDYAKPDYDDSKWTNVNLSDYNTYLPELKTKNIGWFRSKLFIDSSIQKKQLAIQLSQLGASEIYLNGELFKRLGSIEGPSNYKSFNPAEKPLLLPWSTANSIVIAIRFASEVPSRIWLFTTNGGVPNTNKMPLTVRINSWSNAFETYETNVEHARRLANQSYLFVALAFFFILLYILFPKEKVNLLFGAAWLFSVTASLLVFERSQGSLDIVEFGLLSFLLNSNHIVAGILFLSINSIIIFNRVTVYLLIIFFFMVIGNLRFLFFGTPFDAFDFIGHIAVTIAFFHLSISAFRRRIYIIGIGALNGCILNIVFLLVLKHAIVLNLDKFIAYIMTANFILITIYLSRNFARKSKNLEVQFIQIKKLSEDNLKKEREKQELLATQNERLEHQVAERTAELKQSLQELKSTQAQLIQQEKMASLGELTAGVAHEIQNPLNFVNNFSEVNRELVDELQNELKAGNTEDAIAISNDIKENEEKILNHGKRADAIVKGMLQHSRASTGKKEATDVNALVDEYLRLSYHGMRAKDKNFNVELKTEFDPSIPKINVVPQDIGRVLLNLFNNSFYAVNERQKEEDEMFKAIVSVQTKKSDNNIAIIVTDNGDGIPQSIIDKIFHPFFTTKPTGQGTGLGLSLSYDIIKAHGGEIKVESKEGEGSEFVIRLPLYEVFKTN